MRVCCWGQGLVPAPQEGFDFKPFDFDQTRKEVDKAMADYALQVKFPLTVVAQLKHRSE